MFFSKPLLLPQISMNMFISFFSQWELFLFNFLFFFCSMFFEFFQLHYEKFQTQKIRRGTINIRVLSDPKTIFSYLFSLFNILFPSYHVKVSSKLTEIEFRIVVTLEVVTELREHKRTLTLEMFYILVCMALTHVESH